MNLAHEVYLRMPRHLQEAALSLYGLRLQRLRFGGEYPQYLAEVSARENWSRERWLAYQGRALQHLLLHATATVPWYRSRKPPIQVDGLDSLRDLPFSTKTDLRNEHAAFVSELSSASQPVVINTSGTTGSPIQVLASAAALQLNYAYFRRVLDWSGAPRHARTAVFAGRVICSPRERKRFWRRNVAQNAMLFSSYHISAETAPQYLRALDTFAPALIDSYPSSLTALVRYADELGLSSSTKPKGIVTSSETLLPEDRAAIERWFGCRVTDYYGAAEMTAMIAQCPMGTYHQFPDYGILEILVGDRPAGPGEQGELVTTGFVNQRMPLIRYRTGDLGAWRSTQCACGSSFPALESIVGRMDDYLYTTDGKMIGRLDPILKGVSGVTESQIIQHSPTHLTFRYIASDRVQEHELERVARELRLRLGPEVQFQFRRVDTIDRSSGGKLKAVIREFTP